MLIVNACGVFYQAKSCRRTEQLMSLDWTFPWRMALRDTLIPLSAILIAELAHYILFACLRAVGRWRTSVTSELLIRHTSWPARVLLWLLGLTIALARIRLSAPDTAIAQHFFEVCYIAAFTWLTIAFVQIIYGFIAHRFPEDIQDNVHARRVQTQVYLLRQITAWLIAFIGFASILITFPSIRAVGAGLFASAGVAGLVLGMAARPTLGNLIAGIQIALTQPVRIGDSVVVEGESGRVLEVNTTYVVIRLWDLRHLIVPISHFIEKSFQNWTRYSSELIGAVHLEMDYTVPMSELRDQFKTVLESSPLWDGKTMAVQVTDARGGTMEIRLLMSAQNAAAAFDLRCHVREQMLTFLQNEHPAALPKTRSEVRATIEQGRI
jgi:small-conductance mechanosensitive channel